MHGNGHITPPEPEPTEASLRATIKDLETEVKVVYVLVAELWQDYVTRQRAQGHAEPLFPGT